MEVSAIMYPAFLLPLPVLVLPTNLKALIDAAHEMGIAVIMDIVHSHAVKNEVEGLGNFAGDPNQYSIRAFVVNIRLGILYASIMARTK